MARKIEKIALEKFYIEYGINSIYKVILYIDVINKNEIFEIIKKNNDRFKRALFVLLSGNYNNDLYGKENFSKKTKSLTAFKFKKRGNTNYRIYCKEYIDDSSPNIKKVVMISVYNKKSTKISGKLKNHLESIAEYKYDL